MCVCTSGRALSGGWRGIKPAHAHLHTLFGCQQEAETTANERDSKGGHRSVFVWGVVFFLGDQGETEFESRSMASFKKSFEGLKSTTQSAAKGVSDTAGRPALHLQPKLPQSTEKHNLNTTMNSFMDSVISTRHTRVGHFAKKELLC